VNRAAAAGIFARARRYRLRVRMWWGGLHTTVVSASVA